MYSLYRAWLSLGPCAGLPGPLPIAPLNLSSAGAAAAATATTTTASPTTTQQISGTPDVTLQVGPSLTQFSAHATVLSAHSGFFKAALLSHSGPTPISVPNVNVDEFSSLLTFMYTGYLDLNLGNIYNIILATHILHMPRALEICRNFLLQQNHSFESQQQQQRSSIIKPIPSRKILLPSQQIYAPTFSSLHKSETTPFKAVATTSAMHNRNFHHHNNSGSSRSNDHQHNNNNNDDCNLITVNNNNNKASTSKCVDNILQIPIIIDKKSSTDRNSNNNKNKRRVVEITTTTTTSMTTTTTNNNSSNHNDKVIIDIACCDGPVRFHRVINKNYGLQQNQFNDNSNLYEIQEEINRNAVLNKVMNDNINRNCTTTTTTTTTTDENSTTTTTINEMFTCLYCNHTFKSQYCYQKHARRHLNPVSIDTKSSSTTSTQKELITNKQQQQQQQQREVKLLDMNVQYYPCKSCGSKFPSYYFVHKHRKLCHAEEMADNNNKNNEMLPQRDEQQPQQQSNNQNNNNNNSDDTSSSGSNSSAIDVEAVNTTDNKN